MGRKIIELIRGRITYRRTIIDRDTHNEFLLDKFIESGTQSSIIFSLIRNSVDNYISPTEGIEILLRQQFTGGKILRGDDEFMESSANITYYYPIDFTDTYRTYFRFNNHLSYIYPFSRSASSKHVPFIERYRLGGYNNLRGWDNEQISPRFRLLRSPNDKSGLLVSKGGDKKFYSQLEYYLPLIPEAGLKALVFADIGRVYDDTESLSFKGLNKDIGFGFRWITPVAPFRFEWAYPIEDGKLGDLNIVFYIGYD